MDIKTSYRWCETLLSELSQQNYTGTVTIRFVNGGVQSLGINQELHPKHGHPRLVSLQSPTTKPSP